MVVAVGDARATHRMSLTRARNGRNLPQFSPFTFLPVTTSMTSDAWRFGIFFLCLLPSGRFSFCLKKNPKSYQNSPKS